MKSNRENRRLLGQEFVADSTLVFGADSNELRGPHDVTRRWSKMFHRAQKHLDLASLPWVTLKGLRHSHAAHPLELGIQPKVVQERLGHSSIQTPQYHPLPRDAPNAGKRCLCTGRCVVKGMKATCWLWLNLQSVDGHLAKLAAYKRAHGVPHLARGTRKKSRLMGFLLAEDGGFEPPRAQPQHAFQACAIGH